MAMRPTRWLAAALCAAAIGAAGSCHEPPSAETNSYFMARNSPADAARLGCYNSGKSGRMTLFFGSPTTTGGAARAGRGGGPDTGG